MRACLLTLVAGILLSVTASPANAQRFIYRNTYVVPTLYPGNYNYSAYYNSPYGYQAVVNTGVYPTPYGGSNAYYSTATAVRPVYMGPFVSAIWDPTASTYRYTTGYANTANYNYYIPPTYYNPYLGFNPYSYFLPY
jgi:hypothetical protein